MAKTSWLQVTGQNPRPFKTKKAAGEALAAELEHLRADGWEKAWGTLGSACLVLSKKGTSGSRTDEQGSSSGEARKDELRSSDRESEIRFTALVVSTVDVEGYDLDPLFSWRCIRPDLIEENSPQ